MCLEVGASQDSCSDGYSGSEGFSEPESQALRNYMLNRKDNIESYITLHSYGNVGTF